ncbi:hypothetical protein P3X46_020446 [Hevea brasiliensis]|uniref:Receptor-like serine/threonine-protein kinase n=1 Tax=Hevea brasiliensis TaxID=3981 RepID=A0ABQ9LLX4_HEVBR|nr:hypothetical protein P3X46_020446 [Hevea brasiliensis]
MTSYEVHFPIVGIAKHIGRCIFHEFKIMWFWCKISYSQLGETNNCQVCPLCKTQHQTMDARRLFLHSFFMVHLFMLCSSVDTIARNQTIKEGQLLISEENHFALGFFSPGNSRYRYLGIWFHTISEQTVVWVANRDNPITGSSGVLSVNHNGNLVLYGDHDQIFPVWSANVSVVAADACEAQLLDTGNLVLVQGRNKKILWQSFDYPTNTLLQGMKIGVNLKTGMETFLTSWRSAHDPGIGNYSFRLNPSGSPEFYLYKGTNPYWRSIPWPWRTNAEVYKNSFVNNLEDIYYTYSADYSSVIIRVVVEESGLLKRLTWHESDSQWKEYWSAPKHKCDSLGQCGPNSLCDPYNFTNYECACLPGYEPKFPKDWHLRDGSGGCIRKRLESSSVCGHEEGFVKLSMVKIPVSSAAVWVDMSMSQMDCQKECKNNCSCTAYASIPIAGKGTGCLSWYGEIMDTIDHTYYGYDLYVRVDAVELAKQARKSYRSLKMEGTLPILVLCVASVWFVVTIFTCLWLRRKVKKRRNRRSVDQISGYKDTFTANELGDSNKHPDLAFLSLNTILVATNNLSSANKIGQGGFGSVYKGRLANGQDIAVKRLSKNSGQGKEEFKNEVMLIAQLQHRNLVKLLGCCIQGEERILIYEYLPNGSLDLFIFDETRKSCLSWNKRFSIILGIARGILYLHEDSRLRVIHRDLKSSNILLDAEMNPKISDFGLAKVLKDDQIQNKTSRVVGTYGYMSPEYAVFGRFSIKSDVFSFGVVLLEIVSGKKNNGFIHDLSLSLIGHVWELWREDRALEIIDSSLKDSYNPDEALRCIQVGLLCVQEAAFDRPTMLQVVLMLSSETTLPSPKQPAFIFRKSCSSSNSSLVGEDGSACSINDVTITAVTTR